MVQTGRNAEVRHELDSRGSDAGVESEELVDEDAEIREPFDPRLIDVTTEMRSLDTLVRRLSAGQIDLDPDFQRSRGIWTDQKKSLLIESLLLRIPLPTFYVAEIDGSEDLGDSSWAVVDGIQRLSTIAEFVEPDVLGLSSLRLRGLEYLHTEEGKLFHELSSSLQLRILESQFTIQVIRKSTPEPVKLNIFARINTGGVPLSAQELRHALLPGPARGFLRELAHSREFKDAVDHSVSPTRMVDREMALRYVAFRISDPETYRDQDFDSFLRDTMRTINRWDEMEQVRHREDFAAAMRAGVEIFGNDAFRKRYEKGDPRRPVSKALFEAVAVALARVRDKRGDNGLAILAARSDVVKSQFIDLMNEREFDRSVSQGTGDPARVRFRFSKLRELMEAVLEDRS
jgi:Protein of unknown function DUF262